MVKRAGIKVQQNENCWRYLGRGALMPTHPESAYSPLNKLMPSRALVPLIVLTTAAVTTSQALISGVFALTRQATQNGALSAGRR
jgi:KUP system potassium uptake protein